jgi:nuclear GTP-binding protein
MYPLKQRMIEQLTNKKKTAKNQELLDSLMLKNQAKMNINVIKQDDEWEDDRSVNDGENGTDPKSKKEKKAFMKEFNKILEMADIVIEVLDARDPISCRCREAEKLVAGMKGEKKLILVLNKIDLVPLPIIYAWKKELEKEYAVVLFKANTQRQGINYGENRLYQNSVNKNPELVNDMLKSTKSLGTHKLFELLKNYSREGSIKKAVTVGVIGFPNVGKSSIINSLKRKRATGVSSAAGFTKSLQEVEIDSKLKIIDSPGVILSNESEAVLVLRNQMNPTDVKDPIGPISAILDRVNKREIMQLYKVGNFEDAAGFLYNVAAAKGKFKKGGIADLEAAARIVIGDWNGGRMKHYIPPPSFDPSLMIDIELLKEEFGFDADDTEDVDTSAMILE